MRRIVNSTLTDPAWAATTVLKGELVDAGGELKHDPGGNVLLHGYGPVAAALVRAGLLHELHLWVHPVLAGVGSTDDVLFTTGDDARLALAGTRTLGSGVVVLSYRLSR